MARLTNEVREPIVEYVGRFNTDVLVGWDDGLKGKMRYRLAVSCSTVSRQRTL